MTERASRSAVLRGEIMERVRELYALDHAAQPFVPGETYVAYAGRVFDGSEIEALVASALDAWITAGPYAVEFERALAAYTGARGAVFVNSGSSANLLALAACTSPKLDRPLQPGDEVITPAAAFPTTVNPIVQVGCVPVFVDVELGTYNPDPERIERAIGPRTRAIMVAHAVGNPFDAVGLQGPGRSARALPDRRHVRRARRLAGRQDARHLRRFRHAVVLSGAPDDHGRRRCGPVQRSRPPEDRRVLPRLGERLLVRAGERQHLRQALRLAARAAAGRLRSQVHLQPPRLQPEGDRSASGRGARAAPPRARRSSRAAARTSRDSCRPSSRSRTC